jgi:hypothetical protein
LDGAGWASRYVLEEELVQVYKQEKIYWQQRGSVRWILEGDSNTCFFYNIANGKRRKCHIEFLETEEGRISHQKGLVQHIAGFYKKLLDPEDRGLVRLGYDVWQEKGRLISKQMDGLIKQF